LRDGGLGPCRIGCGTPLGVGPAGVVPERRWVVRVGCVRGSWLVAAVEAVHMRGTGIPIP
jgi:hypothetical protein